LTLRGERGELRPVSFSSIRDRNIWLVYVAILLLGLAYGISLALVGLYLDQKGYSKSDIGSLAVWFAGGIVVLSLPMDTLIKRFSARTMLIASLAGYAAAVALFPLMSTFVTIAGIRFLDGAFSVGIWVSCETILLSRANKDNKAFITSLYSMAMAVGYVLGPIAARGIVWLANMPTAFFVSGAISTLAALMVSALLAPDVAETHAPESETSGAPSTVAAAAQSVMWRIKTSCFATFAYGYFQAAVVLFLPLYLIQEKGIDAGDTIYVPAFFAAGMLLFTNVCGRIGDKVGHLPLMRVLAVLGGSMVLGFVFIDRYVVMCAAVFVAGATLASISPLSLALQGVVTKPHEYSRANAVYNTYYAAGMLLGPAISSRIFERFGGVPMLYHLAAVWLAFIVFTMVFRRDDPRVRRIQRERRVALQ
jgi:MFS family permease